LGKKTKAPDDLMRDAMAADESAMSTSAMATLRDLKTRAEARASSAASGDAAAAAAAAAEAARAGPMTDVEIAVVERFEVAFDRDGALQKFEIRGDFEIAVNNPDCAQCAVLTVTNEEPLGKAPMKKRDGMGRINWKTHPRMDAKLWSTRGILRLKAEDKKFKIGRACKTSVLKWRITSSSDEAVPMTIDFWPEMELGKVHITMQYNALIEDPQSINDCVITVPLPMRVIGKRAEIDVESCDGSYNFDARAGELTWITASTLKEGDSGMLDFRIEAGSDARLDLSELWPVSAHFSVEGGLYSGLKVAKVVNGAEFDAKDLESGGEFESDAIYQCIADKFILGEGSD
jgi:hypothetical protein